MDQLTRFISLEFLNLLLMMLEEAVSFKIGIIAAGKHKLNNERHE
jgi:hypothetical protein